MAITRTISVTVPGVQRYYRARLGRTFTFALAASGLMELKGNNVLVDSFDSADPNYSTNGRYDPLKATDRSVVGAYLGPTNSLSVGSAKIYGALWTGPGGSVTIGLRGVVGSRAYVDDPANAGTIEPGHLTDNMNAQFGAVAPPTGSFFVPAAGVYNGTPYVYVLGANPLYQIVGDLNMTSSALVVTNPVILWAASNITFSGSAKIIIAPGGKLTLYGGHSRLFPMTSTTFGGSGVTNLTADPLAFQYYGLPSNTTLTILGNREFVGAIYAPNASLSFEGGASIADFSGSVIAKNIVVNGNFRFHYDEHLGRMSPAF